MTNSNNCGCGLNCTGIAFIASLIIGILAAFFRYTALITVTPAFLWVLFGIAVVFLGITLLTTSGGSCSMERRNCCDILRLFLIGILGTVLTAVILLGVTFAATSALGAIITGLLLFFFSFTLISAVCYIQCKNSCN